MPAATPPDTLKKSSTAVDEKKTDPVIEPEKNDTSAKADSKDQKSYADEANEKEAIEVQDRESAEKLMEIFETWIKAEAENTSFLVKGHPKQKAAFDLMADKMIDMLRDFIVEDKVPVIHTVTKEQLENSFSGFWQNRTKKVAIKRERAKE